MILALEDQGRQSQSQYAGLSNFSFYNETSKFGYGAKNFARRVRSNSVVLKNSDALKV